MFGRLTPVVKNLLIINIVILAMEKLLSYNLAPVFGLPSVLSAHFMPYQFITYMFFHAGWWHLIGNMFGLFIFGPLLESFWGSKRFLTFYLIVGVGAGMLFAGINFFQMNKLENAADAYKANPTAEAFNTFVVKHAEPLYNNLYNFINQYEEQPQDPTLRNQSVDYVHQIVDFKESQPMIGASGAIFGILMAFALLFPNTELMLLFPPIPIKAKYFVGFYGLYELFAGVQQTQGDNIAHWAHVGGMLIAFILLKIWQRDRKNFF